MSYVVLKDTAVGMEAPVVVTPSRMTGPPYNGVAVRLLKSEREAEKLIRDSGPGTYWILDTANPNRSRRVGATTRLSTD